MAADDSKNGSGYVARVRDNTRQYIEEILKENGRLRADLAKREEEHRSLLELLGRAEAETRRFEERFVEVESQNSGLAMLYAASYQLHASLRRTEVLLTIQEIVINLVGSEELVILGLGAAPGLMTVLASVGVDTVALGRLKLDAGVLGRAIARGEPVAAGPEGPEADGVTACIPLTAGGRTIAVVVIFKLLPQKPALGAVDMELFSLLGAHAATALYCAELHERHGDGA